MVARPYHYGPDDAWILSEPMNPDEVPTIARDPDCPKCKSDAGTVGFEDFPGVYMCIYCDNRFTSRGLLLTDDIIPGLELETTLAGREEGTSHVGNSVPSSGRLLRDTGVVHYGETL